MIALANHLLFHTMNHDLGSPSGPTPPDYDTFFPDDENGRLLRKMGLSGVDMDRLHPIDFFFGFPTKQDAAAFHREENEPFAVDCCFEMEGRWIVRITKLLIPTHRTINELQEKLIHIAAIHHGKSAGCVFSPQ